METKKYKKEAGQLVVEIDNEQELFLPTKDGKNEVIGKTTLHQVQYIPKENIDKLLNFIKEQKKIAIEQRDAITKQLEPLKDLEMIDEKLIARMKQILDKGTKEFKQKMLVLNNHLDSCNKKKSMEFNLEHLNKRIEQGDKELVDLEKVL